MKNFKALPLLLISFSFSILIVSCNPKQTQTTVALNTPPSLKPWKYQLDSTYVLKYPDKFAWELFRAINWPADTINMVSDTTRKFGAPGWVVWQTWKTAPEVFLPNGEKPKNWLNKNFGQKSSNDFSSFSLKERLSDISKDPTFGVEEVVQNKSTFDYIVENELYNIDGQLKKYNANDAIEFPLESIEIKVKWRQISDTPYEKARYHWQYIDIIGKEKTEKVLYGLVSMHITSRILKKWLWATFEHIDSRSQKHPGDDGWLLPTKDKFACKNPPYDCERAPTNFGLEGTKWEYFLLRGTQTDYFDESGEVSLLANSNVERGFQLSSSCITCHSLATMGPIGKNGDMQRANFLVSLMRENGVIFGGQGYVGEPKDSLFYTKEGDRMMQTDFAWSLSRANWLKPDSTSTQK